MRTENPFRIFIFMDQKRSLNLLKKKIAKIEENQKENVKHCLK